MIINLYEYSFPYTTVIVLFWLFSLFQKNFFIPHDDDGMSYECLCFLVSCNKFHLIFAHKTRRILVCVFFFVMLRIWEMFSRFNVHAHCRLFAYAFLRPREGKLSSLFLFLPFYIFTWLLNVCTAMEEGWRIVLERENFPSFGFQCIVVVAFYREFIKHEICNKPTFFSHFFHSLVIFKQNHVSLSSVFLWEFFKFLF